MVEAVKDRRGLYRPLLPRAAASRAPGAPRLEPLYLAVLINTVSRVVSSTPALCLRFQDMAALRQMEVSEIVVWFGGLTAMRSLVELAATPALASWSDRVGRRKALSVCCAACFLECTALALTDSLPVFSLVHVLGGALASHNAIEGSCVVDATPCGGWQRGVAFERLFMVLGAAVIIGPAVGGQLSSYSRAAPFVAAACVSGLGYLHVDLRMPEYLPASFPNPGSPPSSPTSSPTGAARGFWKLLRKDVRLQWYACASALSSVGMSAFLSVRTIWARAEYGWDGHQIGRVVSCYGVTLVAAQFVLLPILSQAMRGREARLAQLCLLVHAARFTAYSLAPSGSWVYATLVLSAAGNCSVPVLQSLCSRCVPEDEQALLSGGASALSTASQVVGALLGSRLFAASLTGCVPVGAHLALSAMCFALSALCIFPAIRADARAQRTRRALPSWLRAAEGMSGMDATMPGPTARGSMLLRKKWVAHNGALLEPPVQHDNLLGA
jgi:DHA1 family tetracycline resistance protein-like MFS transporter